MNPSTLTAPAHTPAPWQAVPLDEKSREHTCSAFRIQGNSEFPDIAEVYFREPEEAGPANARLIAAAPDLLRLVRTFAGSCDERLAILNDEMITAPDDADLDDIQAQIDHWTFLKDRCDTAVARTA